MQRAWREWPVSVEWFEEMAGADEGLVSIGKRFRVGASVWRDIRAILSARVCIGFDGWSPMGQSCNNREGNLNDIFFLQCKGRFVRRRQTIEMSAGTSRQIQRSICMGPRAGPGIRSSDVLTGLLFKACGKKISPKILKNHNTSLLSRRFKILFGKNDYVIPHCQLRDGGAAE